MPFIVGFFLGRWIIAFVVFMFTHPLRFLIGLVRIVLTVGALTVGILGPLVFGNGGWAWVVICILAALVLLHISRMLRNLVESF